MTLYQSSGLDGRLRGGRSDILHYDAQMAP